MTRSLALCCMGTWEDSKGFSRSDDGAIVEIARRYVSAGGHVALVRGIGTRFGVVGRVVGGAFGLGMGDRVRDLLAHVEVVEPDVIDVFGFSRGAAEAVLTAMALDHLGREVRFLGLFDCVPQRWVPGFGRDGLPDAIPRNVQHCAHAMAMHEPRRTFQVRRFASAGEVWFPGVHGEQGGREAIAGNYDARERFKSFAAVEGYATRKARSKYSPAFRWMLGRAHLAGVDLDLVDLADVRLLEERSIALEAMPLGPRRRRWREGDRMGAEALVLDGTPAQERAQ